MVITSNYGKLLANYGKLLANYGKLLTNYGKLLANYPKSGQMPGGKYAGFAGFQVNAPLSWNALRVKL